MAGGEKGTMRQLALQLTCTPRTGKTMQLDEGCSAVGKQSWLFVISCYGCRVVLCRRQVVACGSVEDVASSSAENWALAVDAPSPKALFPAALRDAESPEEAMASRGQGSKAQRCAVEAGLACEVCRVGEFYRGMTSAPTKQLSQGETRAQPDVLLACIDVIHLAQGRRAYSVFSLSPSKSGRSLSHLVRPAPRLSPPVESQAAHLEPGGVSSVPKIQSKRMVNWP